MQAVAVCDGRLAEQEVAMQQQLDEHTQLHTYKLIYAHMQAVAARDGRLAEQEVAMQQQLDASGMREHEQLCQLDMLATKFESLRGSCEQQVRVQDLVLIMLWCGHAGHPD